MSIACFARASGTIGRDLTCFFLVFFTVGTVADCQRRGVNLVGIDIVVISCSIVVIWYLIAWLIFVYTIPYRAIALVERDRRQPKYAHIPGVRKGYMIVGKRRAYSICEGDLTTRFG